MAEALKDRYFQPKFIEKLGAAIKRHFNEFDQRKFEKKIYDENWADQALLERMHQISSALGPCLTGNYLSDLEVLKKICHGFNDFDAMLFPNFVELFGQEHFDESLEALEHFTKYSSSEFAIRPFIAKHETETMEIMLAWSKHENEHVRRLASEGCRSRLPWAMALPKFKNDPAPVLPILENLKNDPSLYVRKSVANHLNDITKDNPDIVLNLVEKWNKLGTTPHTEWIIKQALRSLIKAGDERALSLLGYNNEVLAGIQNMQIVNKNIILGDALAFSFDLKSEGKKEQNLVVDFIIHFVKANGTTAPKVFKLKTLSLPPVETITIRKKHPVKPITTRKYYAGQHKLEIQINGKVMASDTFQLDIK